MNRAAKHDLLPPIVADLLSDQVTYIDNILTDGRKRHGIRSLIRKTGLNKWTGTQVSELLYLLLILSINSG